MTWLRRCAIGAGLVLAVAACGNTDSVAEGSTGGDGGDAGSELDGRSWDEIVAQAEEEGEVTYYSAQNQPNIEALEEAFEAEYPDIDLTFVRGLPPDLNPRVETENSTGRGEADVYTTADTRWYDGKAGSGFFTPVVGPTFESEDFAADEFLLADGEYFISHASTIGIGWNTDLLPDGVDGYEGLLDPELAGGKIGIPEASAEALVDFYMYMEELYGDDYLADLAAQEPRIYPGGSAILEALASGEIAASPYTSPTIVDSIDAGAPLDWELPDVAWATLFDTAVLSSAPHPAAAQVLADFILSPEGQVAVGTNYVAVMPGVEGSLLDIDDVRRQPEITVEEVTAYQQEWRDLFQ
jgi:iron(III) transport system substrate-binding protein